MVAFVLAGDWHVRRVEAPLRLNAINLSMCTIAGCAKGKCQLRLLSLTPFCVSVQGADAGGDGPPAVPQQQQARAALRGGASSGRKPYALPQLHAAKPQAYSLSPPWSKPRADAAADDRYTFLNVLMTTTLIYMS